MALIASINRIIQSIFLQSASNPQLSFCYPEAALGEFRKWHRSEYLRDGFPKYLKSKEKMRRNPAVIQELALARSRRDRPSSCSRCADLPQRSKPSRMN